MASKTVLTQELLNEFLDYNPETGMLSVKNNFVRNNRIGSNCFYPGKVLGSYNDSGYLMLNICGKPHRIHRLIFLMVKGYMPRCIDHKNGVRDDNRWENLRECTQLQNVRNQTINTKNTSGHRGVSYIKKSKRYRAYIVVNNKQRHLGMFDTLEAASQRYIAVAKELFGEFFDEVKSRSASFGSPPLF